MQLGGNDSAAEILVTFLFRYGNMNLKLNGSGTNLMTQLTQRTVIETRGQGFAKGMADMGGVYQLDNCIQVFQACFFKLRDKLQRASTDAAHSILGYIIDSQWLRNERQKCQQKLPPLSSHRNSGPSNLFALHPGLSFNWTENTSPQQGEAGARKAPIAGSKRKAETTIKSQRKAESSKQSGQKRSNHQINSPNREDDLVGTDEEAEQLKAGYGLGTGRQGPAATKSRSPANTRTRGRKKPKRAKSLDK
jgi:hypothetical protein